MSTRHTIAVTAGIVCWVWTCGTCAAQDHAGHAGMHMDADSEWHFMQDAMVFGDFNHQSGPRGGDEFVVPDWWMGMASRNTPHGRFTLTAMFSLDPAAVGTDGYRELLQTGETLHGRPLIDRQHPHDFFMQLAGVWRTPFRGGGVTLAAAAAGEPALGPVAFMHRASAIDNPTAPLGHHTFDSTHIAFGVVTAGVDHGPWQVEASIFNGREPDEHRWDFDFGRLDSVSGRVWFRPSSAWELQASTGHLTDPERLEPGDIQRSTVSASWTHQDGGDIASVTAGYGRNNTDHGDRSAGFVEAAGRRGLNSVYARFEGLQVDTALLTGGTAPPATSAVSDAAFAMTIGAVRDVFRRSWLEGGIGADLCIYVLPDVLQRVYGDHPVGVHVFFRLRPAGLSVARMWNTYMTRPPR